MSEETEETEEIRTASNHCIGCGCLLDDDDDMYCKLCIINDVDSEDEIEP